MVIRLFTDEGKECRYSLMDVKGPISDETTFKEWGTFDPNEDTPPMDRLSRGVSVVTGVTFWAAVCPKCGVILVSSSGGQDDRHHHRCMKHGGKFYPSDADLESYLKKIAHDDEHLAKLRRKYGFS